VNLNLVTRNHHCRYCGLLICSDCSSNTLPLDRWLAADAPHAIQWLASSTDGERESPTGALGTPEPQVKSNDAHLDGYPDRVEVRDLPPPP
jgi:hypothetical protein